MSPSRYLFNDPVFVLLCSSMIRVLARGGWIVLVVEFVVATTGICG